MDKEIISKLIIEAENRAEKAQANYQETGSSRYYTTQVKNEELASALRSAMNAEEHINDAQYFRAMVKSWDAKLREFALMDDDQKKEATNRIFEEIKIAAVRTKGE